MVPDNKYKNLNALIRFISNQHFTYFYLKTKNRFKIEQCDLLFVKPLWHLILKQKVMLSITPQYFNII